MGTKIETDLATRGTGAANPSNKFYGIFLQRLTGGIYKTILQFTEAPINGHINLTWGGLHPGDHLRFMFSDEKDGKKITGSFKVYD
jgi:hypothetical protein